MQNRLCVPDSPSVGHMCPPSTYSPNHGTKAKQVFLVTPTRSLFPSASNFSNDLPANCSVTTPLSVAPGVLDRMCDRWPCCARFRRCFFLQWCVLRLVLNQPPSQSLPREEMILESRFPTKSQSRASLFFHPPWGWLSLLTHDCRRIGMTRCGRQNIS